MSTIPVYISVQNQFSNTASSIQMWHQFGSNTPQQYTWTNVPGNGAVTTSHFTADGSTSSGYDYWQIVVTLTNGQVWEHTSWKRCTIESADNGTYQTDIVRPDYWYISLTSGPCSTTLSQAGAPLVAGAQLGSEEKKAAGTPPRPAPAPVAAAK